MYKTLLNTGINYQPQLLSRISEPSTIRQPFLVHPEMLRILAHAPSQSTSLGISNLDCMFLMSHVWCFYSNDPKPKLKIYLISVHLIETNTTSYVHFVRKTTWIISCISNNASIKTYMLFMFKIKSQVQVHPVNIWPSSWNCLERQNLTNLMISDLVLSHKKQGLFQPKKGLDSR